MRVPEEPKRILVIDEFDELRQIMRDILTQAGYEVTLADTCGRAESACADRDFSLIVCNVSFADEELEPGRLFPRLSRHCPQAPIIAMSSDSDLQALDGAIRNGARALLPKPFGSDELLRIVDETLSEDSPFTPTR